MPQNHPTAAALVGLSRYAEKDPVNIDAQEVAEKAYTLAQSPFTSELTRIQAFQVAANLGHEEALPLARDLVGRSSLALKRSALAAIGTLGGNEDAFFLREWAAKNPEMAETLSVALQTALGKIEARQKKAS